MIRSSICFCLLVAFSSICSADTVIDFEALEHEDATFEIFGNQFIEDGFVLSEGNGGDLGTAGTLEPRFSGSTSVAGGAADALYVLTRDGGGTFAVDSIDLAEFAIGDNGTTSVSFTGILSTGGIASQTFTLDGIAFSPETFSFSSDFGSVVALVWQQSDPAHQFDNINVSVVPEPAAATGLVLLALGCAIRRKRA